MKVLLVDDDPRVLELLSVCLVRENFTVERAQNGEEALEKARNGVFDVIILDIMLPKQTGFEVISALRAIGNNTPILAISARSMIEDRVKGLNLGADDYLVKNFAVPEFIARVKSLMRRPTTPQSRRSNVLRCQDLVVNMSDMSVSRGGKEIYLSRKEMGILIELMRSKNKITGREHLIRKVWGDREIDVMSNTIDVHIRMLRGKIDRKGSESLIKTLRGRGYIMYDASEIKAEV